MYFKINKNTLERITKMKKLIIGILSSSFLTFSAFAESANSGDVDVKLHGKFEFQAAHREQKKLEGDNQYLSANRKKDAFYTNAGLGVEISNTLESGFKYGANIVLQTTTKSSGLSNHGSYLFTESDYGKLEAGSNYAAMSMMSVSGYNISAATGDAWFNFTNLYNDVDGIYDGKIDDYAPVYVAPVMDGSSEELRVVSFYSPKFKGLQLGVSYIPDGSSFGNSGLKSEIPTKKLYNRDGDSFDAKISMKDSVSVGLTYEHNISDGVDVLLGAGFQKATNSSKISMLDSEGNKIEEKLKLKDYSLYNFGAVINYGNIMLGGSYADAGKSMTNPDYNFAKKRQNKFYTAAVGYTSGPIGLSLTYFKNDKGDNKLDSYTLGTDCKLAPGLQPYFEVTSFKVKNRGFDTKDGMKQVNIKQNGMVYLLGTKIKF